MSDGASRKKTGPLAGMRIVDMSSVLMGPFATQMLADYGADVVKVESPEGDLMRLGGAMRNPKMGSIFLQANRGKRSIVLDVKKPAGRRAFLTLCESADAVIHNVRTAAMARLRLAYEDVRTVAPAIVYVSLVGYGEDGPYAGKPAYDDLIQGISGVASLFAAGGREPRFAPVNMADRVVGLNAVHAVLAALLHRERTGEGQSIEVPMFETMAQFVLGDHFGGLAFEPPEGPPGYNRLLSPDRRPYRTSDGHLCVLVYTDRQWRSFFEAIGEPELFADPLYSDHATRTRNYDRVYAELARHLATRTTAAWTELLTRHDIPCVPAHDVESLLADPHIRAVGLVQSMEHPTEGTIRLAGPPARWSRTPPAIGGPPPNLGEHTREVLAEAGFGEAEIDAMIEEGAAAG